MTYIGSPGGLTQYGNVRKVFYSNSAAPIIRTIVSDEGAALRPLLVELKKEKAVKAAISNQDIARRFEALLDLVEEV